MSSFAVDLPKCLEKSRDPCSYPRAPPGEVSKDSWDMGYCIPHGASVLEDFGTSSGLLGMSIPLVPGL